MGSEHPVGVGYEEPHSFAIGVIGGGPVGTGIATLLARAGYSVTLGAEHPPPAIDHMLPSSVAVGRPVAAADCPVVVLAVGRPGVQDLVTALSDRLAGKVLIDANNPLLPEGYRLAGSSAAVTEGRWLSRLLPKSRVVRAFSHVDWDLLVPSATNEPGRWAVAYSADDEQAASTVAALILDTGYVPVRIGDLDADELDVGGVLWPGMFTPDQMRAALRGRSEEGRPGRRGADPDG